MKNNFIVMLCFMVSLPGAAQPNVHAGVPFKVYAEVTAGAKKDKIWSEANHRFYSVEDAIDLHSKSIRAFMAAGDDEKGQHEAYSIIKGVPNPQEFNDPDMDAKVQSYYESRTSPIACGTLLAICDLKFYSCLGPVSQSTYEQYIYCSRLATACHATTGCVTF